MDLATSTNIMPNGVLAIQIAPISVKELEKQSHIVKTLLKDFKNVFNHELPSEPSFKRDITFKSNFMKDIQLNNQPPYQYSLIDK